MSSPSVIIVSSGSGGVARATRSSTKSELDSVAQNLEGMLGLGSDGAKTPQSKIKANGVPDSSESKGRAVFRRKVKTPQSKASGQAGLMSPKVTSPCGNSDFQHLRRCIQQLNRMGGRTAARAVCGNKRKSFTDEHNRAVKEYLLQCKATKTLPGKQELARLTDRNPGAAMSRIRDTEELRSIYDDIKRVVTKKRGRKGGLELIKAGVLKALRGDKLPVRDNLAAYASAFQCECGGELVVRNSCPDALAGRWGPKYQFPHYLACNRGACNNTFTVAVMEEEVNTVAAAADV